MLFAWGVNEFAIEVVASSHAKDIHIHSYVSRAIKDKDNAAVDRPRMHLLCKCLMASKSTVRDTGEGAPDRRDEPRVDVDDAEAKFKARLQLSRVKVMEEYCSNDRSPTNIITRLFLSGLPFKFLT